MRQPDYLHSLAQIDVLSECSRSELNTAASLLTPLVIRAGETVVREHSIGREFLIIVAGSLEVTTGTGPNARLLGTVGAGEIVGEMSLLNHTPRSATVTTTSPTTVYAGSAREFFAFLDAAPSAAERIIATARVRADANRAA